LAKGAAKEEWKRSLVSSAEKTIKHRQSYRHSDPRRQQQHTAVAVHVTSNSATVTFFITMWPWPLTFWPLSQCTPSDCYRDMCTTFSSGGLSRFPFRAQTNKQTDIQTRLNAESTPAAITPAYVINFAFRLHLIYVALEGQVIGQCPTSQ